MTGASSEPSTSYSFLPGHPFAKSQMIRLLSPDKHVVPNMIGGPLPRKDQGDREYYCKTMLTLLKPWRIGKHLKAVNESWDDAFYNHSFTEQQTYFLKNINIRYECKDKNDDYWAQLSAGSKSG
ncbi:hypothetical protein BDN72DRAFT_779906, partial [Pluteus cervinus]